MESNNILKLPITAIIVGLNESKQLRNCLRPLNFCDEILYFDLGSTDDSSEVATSFGAVVINHEKVPCCEWIHSKFANQAKNEWILITDPDEVINSNLVIDIIKLFKNENFLKENIGAISAPWFFYFKNKKLRGTNWGGVNRRILLANNKRFEFSPLVHVGRNVFKGYKIYDIEFNGENFIHHFWMTTYTKLFEKHLRYLKYEGEARYKIGKRVSIIEILKEPIKSFKYSFLLRKGYKDGFTGFFLSLFWAWYESSAKFKNYIYQQKNSDNNKLKNTDAI